MSWKARFADDCVLSSVGDEKREVVVSQAPSAGRQHGQRDGDGAVDPGVTGSTVWDGAVVLAQVRFESTPRPPFVSLHSTRSTCRVPRAGADSARG